MNDQILDSNTHFSGSGSSLSPNAIDSLRSTAPWLKFMSIMGFIFIGLIIIAGFVAMVSMASISNAYGGSYPGLGMGTFLIYIVMGIVMLFPNIYLLQYANRLKEYCNSNMSNSIEEAFKNQKKYWKFMGIIMIIGLAIMFIALLVMVFALLAANRY